jgi:hypothetical protein
MTRKLVSVVLGILILSSVAMAQDNAKISLLISDLDRNESHFMLGLDMIVIGSMIRDAALGYPRSAVGMSPLLGVSGQAKMVINGHEKSPRMVRK